MSEELNSATELAVLKAGQGEAVATVSWRQPSCEWTLNMLCELAIGEGVDVPLYTAPPASADARLVPVELLERVVSQFEDDCKSFSYDIDDIRAMLAQSE